MAGRAGIGNRIAPWRFILFGVLLVGATAISANALHNLWLGIMAGFDLAAVAFLCSCVPILSTREQAIIRQQAAANDANRPALLVLTAVVTAVLLVAIAAESVGRNPEPVTRVLIIGTLAIAWLFSNMVYALHYAHLAYSSADLDCSGFSFPKTPQPTYWDFVYFAVTCGMAFATSDVEVTNEHVRKVVIAHCLAAFAFNIGVLAFTINLLASGN